MLLFWKKEIEEAFFFLDHPLTFSRLQDLCCATLALSFHLENSYSFFRTQFKTAPSMKPSQALQEESGASHLLSPPRATSASAFTKLVCISGCPCVPIRLGLLESGHGIVINMFLDFSQSQHLGEPNSKGKMEIHCTWPSCKNIFKPPPSLRALPLVHQLPAMSPDLTVIFILPAINGH